MLHFEHRAELLALSEQIGYEIELLMTINRATKGTVFYPHRWLLTYRSDPFAKEPASDRIAELEGLFHWTFDEHLQLPVRISVKHARLNWHDLRWIEIAVELATFVLQAGEFPVMVGSRKDYYQRSAHRTHQESIASEQTLMLGKWLQHQRRSDLSPARAELLDRMLPGWRGSQSARLSFEESAYAMGLFVREQRHWPRQKAEDARSYLPGRADITEGRLGRTLHAWRTQERLGQLSAERRDLLRGLFGDDWRVNRGTPFQPDDALMAQLATAR